MLFGAFWVDLVFVVVVCFLAVCVCVCVCVCVLFNTVACVSYLQKHRGGLYLFIYYCYLFLFI